MARCFHASGMNLLFPIEPSYPEGFSYVQNFISAEEEELLLEEISRTELHQFQFQGYEAKRRVASFGYDYNFENGSLIKGSIIPPAFAPLIQKVSQKTSITSERFAELLVTEYPPGAVINWHRDAPPFDVIAGISLQAGCIFRFRPYEKGKQSKVSVVSINVERRSLYVMEGKARTDFQHSIAPVKNQRYSITLRTLRRPN